MKSRNILRLIPIIMVFLLIVSCASKPAEKSDVAVGLTEINEIEKEPDKRDAEPAEEGGIIDDADYGVRESEITAAEKMMPMMVEETDVGLDGSFAMKSAVPGTIASGSASGVPGQSGLKAGYEDDNRQYSYFLKFLEDFRENVTALDLDVSERITLKVLDAEGKTVPGALVRVSAGKNVVGGFTLADGSFQINPSEIFPSDSDENRTLKIEIDGGPAMPGFSEKLDILRNGERAVEITSDRLRVIPEPVPLDVVFVMDTTGSMGEEISRLKNTIQIIHMNLSTLSVAADVRFGMVLYRDVGDEYRTSVIPLTGDIDEFQIALNEVEASGGGDMPEDLEAALEDLVKSMKWNNSGIKLAYVITDAPPHLDYNSMYTCSDAVRDARRKGIKIYGIGTGGLDLQGEYNLRQIAQYTSARYIFLTYGSETGESEGGAPGSVSHHTGANWSSDKLESIIIRFTREELSYLTDSPLLDEDPWFEAGMTDTEEAEETLASLFSQALEQLIDFSSIPLSTENALAVLPFQFEGVNAADAEYFNEHLVLAAGGNKRIRLAERKDIGQLLNEIEFQNIGVTDDDTVVEIGEFLNADILLSGNLFIKDGKYELFLKLLRVETAEILSVTRAVIDVKLGLLE